MTTLSTMMVLMTILAWTMLSMNNPMNLSLTIMLMATCTSISYGLFVSPWYALILFLVYVGGMMIMFSYFISLSSNDSMALKSKLHLIVLPMSILMINNYTMMPPKYNSAQIYKMYINKNTTILLLITMVLLMMMVITVKMMKSKNKPLRGFMINS